ncbi:PD-(D/E)XK nuclease family transposase [bacterium]|nr:PD-(D/E)XK nuclease family transposase [bacterium]
MYIAPLNYDRFFKRVFSDKKIAKTFLEDILEFKIKEIEILQNKNFLTDNSIAVEFDYRCKLNTGEHVIVEMQQWHKVDVVKRFYLYHSLSTSLQLEGLREILLSVNPKTKTVVKDKIYNDLNPVITVVWMVEDTLGFQNDYIEYRTDFENYKSFILDESIWIKSIEEIKKERAKLLKLNKNQTKNLDFIQKNRLIFMFQQNIVKNNKDKEAFKSYVKWFNFASKSKNKENKKEDFKYYENDKTFSKIIKQLLTNRLEEDDMRYIATEEEFKEIYLEFTSSLIQKSKELEEKDKELEEKDKELEEKDNIIKNSIKTLSDIGLSKEKIAQALNISIKKVEELS